MSYEAPGRIAGASQAVLSEWNKQIETEIDGFFKLDDLKRASAHIVAPEKLAVEPIFIKWTADPAEPRFCLDDSWAQKLSDWGVRGRHLFQNEYCEYNVITKVDEKGRVRLKRFTATTELAEWWTTVATVDPLYLKQMSTDVLKRSVSYDELYGEGVGDPLNLSREVRRIRFATQVAGHGKHEDLKAVGVPQNPVGDLNRANALFMSHPINGLDDLLYIVIFGAQPYVVNEDGKYRIAKLHEIFNEQGTAHLACRNADPAAAFGAFKQILQEISPDGEKALGCKIAFANPLGMYFVSFQRNQLEFNGERIPDSWVTESRGVESGLPQRLEIGPSDDEPYYLDEILIRDGDDVSQITGGYQLAKLIEVGPLVLVGPEEEYTPDLFVVNKSDSPDCSEAEVCTKWVGPAKKEYEKNQLSPNLRGF